MSVIVGGRNAFDITAVALSIRVTIGVSLSAD